MQESDNNRRFALHFVERGHTRRAFNSEARIRSINQGQVGGQVLDISEKGCKLVLHTEKMLPGQSLTIKIPEIETLVAYVRWRKGKIVGVEFVRPMHSAVVDHLVRKQFDIKFD